MGQFKLCSRCLRPATRLVLLPQDPEEIVLRQPRHGREPSSPECRGDPGAYNLNGPLFQWRRVRYPLGTRRRPSRGRGLWRVGGVASRIHPLDERYATGAHWHIDTPCFPHLTASPPLSRERRSDAAPAGNRAAEIAQSKTFRPKH